MAGRAASTKAAEQMKRHGQRQMVQRAKQAAKAAASLTRKIAAAVTRAVAALIGAVTAFAGGAVLLVALCVVILVAAVVSSPFGIFFSDEEKAPGAIAPYAAISQINTEYFDRLESLKAGNYDSVDVQGQPPNWREVLAVFACKTAGTDDGVDVATFDADRVERLRMVFWDMTAITSYVETIHHSGDGEDNPGWTERILHITITPKTAEDMAAEYGFSEDMRSALAELLNEDNGPFWAKILYGSASDTEIVAVAFSQLGNEGGGPYWSWYGFSSREEWCACFVSWCANECGYIEAGIIPKFAVCITGSNWFKERGQWAENTAEPSPGAIIFFDWDDENGQDGEADHVGIVERVEDGRVYTIEGNSGDQVCQNSYPVGYYEIYGYGLPAYG
ncbi:CHAP domain-containing protein [Pseudoflavonifractor sp. BIOML-A16]|nr:CHAP domain-containing protein [Pseudoflavonifractor sp. BIOML-A16]MTS89692.1 CHAP domain-containing protein [Pseudoflavonifractor sp. BIOML-A4]